MNVSYKVVNDEASGAWASGRSRTSLGTCRSGACRTAASSGPPRWWARWTTFAGALSPGAGVAEATGGSGLFLGVLNGTFTSSNYIPCVATSARITTGHRGRCAVHVWPDWPSVSWSPGDTLLPRVGRGRADNWSRWSPPPSRTPTFTASEVRLQLLTNTTTGDIITK